MARICKIHYIGSCVIGANWKNNVRDGINRMYYINGGDGGYFKNDEKIPFEHDKVYFIPFYSNTPTYTNLDNKLDHTYSTFFLSPPVIATNVFCIDPNESPTVRLATDIFRNLCEKYVVNDMEAELLKSALIYLSEYAIKENSRDIINDPTIISALDIMHNSPNLKLSVADIAAKCYMTPDGFTRKFKRFIGESPSSYLKRLKVRAALTLKAEGIPMKEIAEICGYSDASSLAHAISSTEKREIFW